MHGTNVRILAGVRVQTPEQFNNGYPNIFTTKGHTSYCGLVRGAASGQIAVSGILMCLNYCLIITGNS